MKNTITFAQFVCLMIIVFGLSYHGYVTCMSFSHAVIPQLVLEIKGDVNIWMTSALAFAIGSTVNSQKKDQTIKDALAATPPPGIPENSTQTTVSATTTQTGKNTEQAGVNLP